MTGIAPSYEIIWDERLNPHINKKKYFHYLENLNETITMMFPCCMCMTYGYLMSICTLGFFMLR